MLKVWNVSLIGRHVHARALGHVLVVGGLLESIHAFGESTVGGWFLALIAVVLAGSTALVVDRLDDLRSERRIDSLLAQESRPARRPRAGESWFVIFWGTFLPLSSEGEPVTGASDRQPWFDRYTPCRSRCCSCWASGMRRTGARLAAGVARARAAETVLRRSRSVAGITVILLLRRYS